MNNIHIDLSETIQFGDLLGSLMGSLIDAQSQAARATADFILDVGTIEKDLSGVIANELNSVSFKYKKYNANGDLDDFSLQVPILSLVEIPSISVKNAKFSFYYDVRTDQNQKVSETITGQDRRGLFKRPVLLSGKVNRETNTTANITKNGGVKIDVEIERSAMTPGLERILDMLELAAKDIGPDLD